MSEERVRVFDLLTERIETIQFRKNTESLSRDGWNQMIGELRALEWIRTSVLGIREPILVVDEIDDDERALLYDFCSDQIDTFNKQILESESRNAQTRAWWQVRGFRTAQTQIWKNDQNANNQEA